MNMTLNDLQRVAARLPWDLQQRLSSNLVSQQRQYEATKAEVLRVLHTQEGQQLLQRLMAPKPAQARPRQAHPSIIQRRATPDLRQMQAEYNAMVARDERVLRQARRERAGVR